MNVLVLNCGSATVKFQIIATDLERIQRNTDEKLAYGVIERIGGEAIINFGTAESPTIRSTATLRDHKAAIETIISWAHSETTIPSIKSVSDIHAVGHRVVHGGERFKDSVLITEEVIKGIEECIELAPLHNPANLRGIEAATAAFGRGIPQVAVFDTSFHQTMPEHAFLYALPYQLYRRYKVRRYGFHGISYRYVAYRYRQLTGCSKENTNIIALHLGNGCSIAAIKNGISIDTSMGFTPLEGLVMGTRSGDIDPAIVDYVAAKEGLTAREVDLMLNKQSGLLGISCLTNDMRELLDEVRENNDRRARLAIEIFCYRIRKYLGAYLAVMNGTDSIIFTGGIGQNAPVIREEVIKHFAWCGIKLDPEKNYQTTKEGVISTKDSHVSVMVIPTDEELLIARDTVRKITSARP
ncbi:MAG: acetate kinase [Acidobacteriota bacterium]|nr:acetate kinase [Blastocatellia bacterium]MDW8411729.1 acetate kinase [Acidobacteriota bacterium]